MPRPVLAPVDPSGITKAQILYDPRKGDVSYLDCQVDMIAHEAEGVEAMSEPLNSLLQEEVEADPVSVIEEDGLPCVASQGDMIECSRVIDSWLSGHGPILNQLIATLQA